MKVHNGRRKRKTIMTVAIVSGVVVVGFLTWMVIGLINQATELELVAKYELPNLVSLENQYDNYDENWAVAIAGEVATGSDNANEVRPTASTTKMILGLAVMKMKPFELNEPGETITITEDFYNRYVWYVNHGGSTTAVQVGEEISEYDALMSVFLASSNNMADSLAEWAFGSLDNYREYANEMLSEWGINDTMIGVDASGFDASTTSTAADLAKIGQKVLENPVLAEIVGTKSYTVPVAGTINNTNALLGQSGIIGVKTGYIGDSSGYCLVTGYLEGRHVITAALLGAPTRAASFADSLGVVEKTQDLVKEQKLVSAGEMVGYYDSWWTGPVKIMANEDLTGIGWSEAKTDVGLEMDGSEGTLKITIGGQDYTVNVTADEYNSEPSFGERLAHLFGWKKEGEIPEVENTDATDPVESTEPEKVSELTEAEAESEPAKAVEAFTNAPSNNCTIKLGALMLINPNFKVENDFIAARRGELVSISAKYGIVEGNANNGDNLLDAEAAEHITAMINAYKTDYPGHTMETRSCFRAVGTSCGRLCAATGTSDHHTGLTCDLLDPAYGTSLDTDTYSQHLDWQWLKANSYKYGFIDRFPEAWAGGSMSEPLNVDANGTTGLYETWHYRYVGVGPATEIATGKYNNGQYDSLEHYLKARGLVADLKNGTCK